MRTITSLQQTLKLKQNGIEARVLFVALAPVVATAVALTLYFTLLRYNDVETALRQRGFAMARQLSAAAQYGLFSGNVAELNRLIQALAHEPDITAITVYDSHGRQLAAIGHDIAAPSPDEGTSTWIGRSQNGRVLSFHSKVFASTLPFDDPYSDKTASPTLLLGSIAIELSRDNLIASKLAIMLFAVLSALSILLIAGMIARRLGRDITEPVLALEDSVRKISEGHLSTRVRPHPAGTLRTLEEGINSMSAALEQAQMRSTKALISSHTELKQQSDFANALLKAQSSTGVCMTIVENGQNVFANQASADFTGRPRAEVEHLSPYDILAPDDRQKLERLCLGVLRGDTESYPIEISVLTPEGEVRYAEIAAFKTERGNTQQIVILGVDITQRKKVALELLNAHQRLQEQKEEAERANVAKSRFLAAASHDLRQPLHALSLFADQLPEYLKTPEQARLANQIGAAINSMSELLETLLDISKLDVTPHTPEINTIALGPLLEKNAAGYKHAAANKQLQLTVMPSSFWVESDPRYLSRIISNLVANAVRYTERGRILIGARRKGSHISIEIWDTGIGIEKKHLPFLFQEFYQVANAERDLSKGLGLGLAIVDRLVSILGHKVSVRSTPGAGSVFTVLVPLATPGAVDLDLLSHKKSAGHILLAIGDKAWETELSAMLKHWNYSVSLYNPSEAARAWTNSDDLPDLIIGEQSCLDRLRQDQPKHLAALPVILLYDEQEQVPPVQLTDSCQVLEMPAKPARLRALMLHLLAQND